MRLELRQLLFPRAEDVGVVLADGVHNLHVRAVHGAEGERAVHHELHVRGAGRLLAGGGDLLRDIRGRDDPLCGGDVVVFHEHHVDVLRSHRVVVHQLRNGVDELDNALGGDVARCRLGTEDKGALGHIPLTVDGDAEVQIQDVQRVHELALVFVQALDLGVKDGVRVDLHALALGDPVGEVALVRGLDLAQFAQHLRVVDMRTQLLQLGQVGDPLVAAGEAVQQRRQPRVAHTQPAARGHAVGLVVEAIRVKPVPEAEGVAFDDVGVQRRHTVDRVRGVAGDPRHVHSSIVHRGVVVRGLRVDAARLHVQAVAAVNLLHNFPDAPKQLLEDGLFPRLQRLLQHRVVGVGEGVGGHFPGVVPAEAVLVHKQPHQLGDAQDRVGVVELDGVECVEVAQVVAVGVAVVVDKFLQRGRDEEVLLAHAEELACVG